MSNKEFSNEFDVLYNNIMSNQAPGLDEYEKSVLLTKAQYDVVLGLYNNSFEGTEEIRRYLSNLIKTYTTSTKESGHKGISNQSIFFKLPNDLLFITYESATFVDGSLNCNDKDIIVVPVTQDDYYKTKNNPFRSNNNRRILRLDLDNNLVELVSQYDIKTYFIKYIKKPDPIVLIDLQDGLSIEGISTKTECQLNPSLHKSILDRAVELANVYYKA